MRRHTKSNIAGIEKPGILRDLIQRQDIQLKELSAAIKLLSSGRAAQSAGTVIYGGSRVVDHGVLTGLNDDDHAQYLLLAGRAAQQTVTTTSASLIPLDVRGTSGQSTDYFRIQTASNTDVLRMTNTSTLRIGVSTAYQDHGIGIITHFISGASSPLSIISASGSVVLGKNLASGPRLYIGEASGTPVFSTGWNACSYGLGAGSSSNAFAVAASASPAQFWASATGAATANIVATMSHLGVLKARGLQLSTTATGTVDMVASTAATSYSVTMPPAQGAASAILQNDGTGVLSWTASPTVAGIDPGTGLTVTDIITFISSGGGDGVMDFSGVTSAGVTYTMPNGSGQVVIANAIQTLNSKTMGTGTKVLCNTGAGTTFQDATTTTKQMRLDLSGIAASSTRSLKIPDLSGTNVVVGNTTSASGTLGASSLTAQTASIASTTLLTGTSSTAGMFRVSAYLKTTTAGSGGDIVTMTVSYNDGAAQTIGMPFLTTGGAAANHDLATLNAHSQGSVVLYSAASQNVTFTTTVTKTGSPQYSIYVRIEAL